MIVVVTVNAWPAAAGAPAARVLARVTTAGWRMMVTVSCGGSGGPPHSGVIFLHPRGTLARVSVVTGGAAAAVVAPGIYALPRSVLQPPAPCIRGTCLLVSVPGLTWPHLALPDDYAGDSLPLSCQMPMQVTKE